jgi:single-strand DNA-binding protein
MYHGNPVVTLAGGLVAPPEVKFTSGGIALATFTVVTTDRKRTEGGAFEDTDKTYWDCTAWRRTAENLAESDLRPGDRVIVLGTIRQENWETKEGEKRSKHKVQADHVGVGLDFRSVSVRRVDRESAPSSEATASESAPF